MGGSFDLRCVERVCVCVCVCACVCEREREREKDPIGRKEEDHQLVFGGLPSNSCVSLDPAATFLLLLHVYSLCSVQCENNCVLWLQLVKKTCICA